MSDTQSSTLVVESHPTIKPTAIQMAILFVIGLAIIVYFQSEPDLVGDPEIAQIGVQVTSALVILGLLRLAIRVFVYTRTTYEVTADRVRKTYDLLYRRQETEVPYELVRSHEFSQGRLETLLGYGTVKLNQGLGTLTLKNIEEPHVFNEEISKRLE